MPKQIDSYILWLLTPKVLLMLDIFLLFLKLFFVFVEQFIEPDTLYGSVVVVVGFGAKLIISPLFMCGKARSQIYYMNACFIVRIIYDILVIVPLAVFMIVISYSHWSIAVIVGVILLVANLLSCCLCVWDSYKFIDKYEQEYLDPKDDIERSSIIDKSHAPLHDDDSDDLYQYSKPKKIQEIEFIPGR